jgi:hypothetical protein
MSAATVTVNVTIPPSEKKAQEVVWATRALAMASQAIESQGGLVTSGNLIDGFGVNLGSWSYSSGASS